MSGAVVNNTYCICTMSNGMEWNGIGITGDSQFVAAAFEGGNIAGWDLRNTEAPQWQAQFHTGNHYYYDYFFFLIYINSDTIYCAVQLHPRMALIPNFPTDTVTAIGFNASMSSGFSTGADKTIRFYRTKENSFANISPAIAAAAPIPVLSTIGDCALRSDGRILACASWDGSVSD
jgi:hypothetical protein